MSSFDQIYSGQFHGRSFVPSGASLEVESGGTLQVESGATIELLGTISIGDDEVIALGDDDDGRLTYSPLGDTVTLDADTAGLTLSTTTSGTLTISGAALVDIDAGANLDIDVTGDTTIDSTGAVSIEGVGNSDLTTDAGNLTIATTTSGDIELVPAGGVQVQDASDNTKILSFDPSSITTGNTRSLAMADQDVDLGQLVYSTWSMAVLGDWAVDGDDAATNGAGLCGATPDLTAASNAYALVYDEGTTSYQTLSGSSSLGDWAADWQVHPDAASEEVNDAAYFGADIPFCEIGLVTSQAATWAGNGALWEYWDGSSWSTLSVAYDATDTTANDGLRPLQQPGAVAFVPPADWAANDVNGQTAYWIRSRITAAQLTQPAIMDSRNHDIVAPTDGFISPHDATITDIRLVDGASTLHSTTDVKFILHNYTTGDHSGELTFAQDQRTDSWTLTLAVSAGDELGVLCTQEDSAAEPLGVVLELGTTQA